LDINKCQYEFMKEDKSPKISDVCAKALDDLDKLEVEFSISEARLTEISGRMIFHLKDGIKSTH